MNKHSYVIYNDNGYLVTMPITVNYDSGVLELHIDDTVIPSDPIEYQLINVYIPDDADIKKDDSIYVSIVNPSSTDIVVDKL